MGSNDTRRATARSAVLFSCSKLEMLRPGGDDYNDQVRHHLEQTILKSHPIDFSQLIPVCADDPVKGYTFFGQACSGITFILTTYPTEESVQVVAYLRPGVEDRFSVLIDDLLPEFTSSDFELTVSGFMPLASNLAAFKPRVKSARA
jgi:hypothetical protein